MSDDERGFPVPNPSSPVGAPWTDAELTEYHRENFERPQHGTSMHYPDCIWAQCSGCFLPGVDVAPIVWQAPERPMPRGDAPEGFSVIKWESMSRRDRRAATKGRRHRDR